MAAQAFEYYAFIDAPTTIFAARVNQTAFDQTIAQLTFDTVTSGAFGDIEAGMMMLLGSSAGADDLGRARIRKAATSTIIYFGWSSKGRADGEIAPANNMYITVTDDRRVWSKIPRIDDDGALYKDFDTTFVAADAQPPVANCGPGYAAFIDSGTSKITVEFDGANSLAIASGASISAYLWDVDDGTITVGVSTDSAITATFPAGKRWISLKVTDSNSKTHTAFAKIVAAEKTGANAPLRCEIKERALRVNGQSMRIRVTDSIPQSTYPDGAFVMVWMRQWDDGAEVTPAGLSGREQMLFSGWHDTDRASGAAGERGYITETELSLLDVAGRLEKLPGFPQIVEREASPTSWAQMANAAIDRYLHYILHWHSSALELADYAQSGLDATYPFPVLGSDGASLYRQVDQRAQAISHRFTCNSYGQLAVNPDPMLIDHPSDTPVVYTPITRAATSQLSLVIGGISQLQFTHTRSPRVHWNWGAAIVATATDAADLNELGTVFCLAPGQAPGQGLGEATSGEQLVTDKDELNAREGHRYLARMNADNGAFQITPALPYPGQIEPADMTWITVTIDSDLAAERGLVFTSERFLPQEVSYNYGRHGVVRSVIVAEREILGELAATYIPPAFFGGSGIPPGQGDFPRSVFTPASPDPLMPPGINNMAVFQQGLGGRYYTTTDFQTPDTAGGPTWTVVDLATLGLAGVFQHAMVDPFSPLYLGTGSTVDVWVASGAEIGKITDIFGSPSFASQHTWATTTTGSTRIHLQVSRGIQNYAMAWQSHDLGVTSEVRIAYTTDGSSWTEVVISTGNFNGIPRAFGYISPFTPGLAYSPSAEVGGTGTDLYRSNDSGATWAKVVAPPSDGVTIPSGIGNILCTMISPFAGNTSDRIHYWLYWDGAAFALGRSEADGATVTDITPAVLSGSFANQLATSPVNRQRIILATVGGADPVRIYRSFDAGDTWQDRSANLSNLRALLVWMGNDNQAYFICVAADGGQQGIIAQTPDFLVTSTTHLGNMEAVRVTNGAYIMLVSGG